jgi:hypothetical protein
MHKRTDSQAPTLSALERERIVSIAEAARLTSLSQDVVRRRFRDQIIRLSERRCGLKLGVVLDIGNEA